MSSPASVIPEIRTLDGLMNALTLTKAMCEMRSEEAIAIAADDKALSNRLDQIEAELAELEVDSKTRAEIDELRDSIRNQSQAAAAYGAAAKDAGDFAMATAAAAYKSHGGIAEAVQSSPVERAAQAGYYDR
jgi:4-hydroxy-L-threonine phosphate dehydrogenase PdxA